MTDLEMTKLCAEAMWHEYFVHDSIPGYWDNGIRVAYDPLNNDVDAMTLIKEFRLELTCDLHHVWIASNRGTIDYVSGNNKDLNRAIVECVAKMRAAKVAA